MINKSVGRFCPLAYFPYNILLLFSDGYISPKAHYMLEAIFFVIYAAAFTIMVLLILKHQKSIWKYSIAFFVYLLCIGRAYPQYTECFSTAWCFYTLMACFFLFSYLFHEHQGWGFGIVALLFANILCYSSELGFIFPLGVGGSALLFSWKTISKKEKLFDFSLVGSAMLFLFVYLVFIVPYTNQYMTHVIDDSPISNALRMLVAQKILAIGFIVLLVRLVFVIWKKQPYEYFDAFLLTAFASFCACAILKLNWTLYYNPAALLCIPAILYYLVKYLKPQYALALVAAMGLFYGFKIPKAIKHSQSHRITVFTNVGKLTDEIKEGVNAYWMSPITKDEDGFKSVLRDCKRSWLTSYVRWNMKDVDYEFASKEETDTLCPGVWLMWTEDKNVFYGKCPDYMGAQPFFKADSIYGYLVGAEFE